MWLVFVLNVTLLDFYWPPGKDYDCLLKKHTFLELYLMLPVQTSARYALCNTLKLEVRTKLSVSNKNRDACLRSLFTLFY